MSRPVLQVRALVCRYEKIGAAAVKGVTFEVEEGELLALVGPSGCGKSTTLRAVAGLEPVQSGELVLAGRTLAGAGVFVPPEQRGIGLVFQDLALFPHLSAEQNVAFGLRRHAPQERSARTRELFSLVSLTGLEARRPGELSGGQQQRVAVARALAPRPSLLLMDEPFSSLDATLREELRAELRALLKRLGTAAILVTHDRSEVFAFADRVAVMNAGNLEQVGTPEDIYAAPATAFVATFMGEGTLLPAKADGDRAVSPLGIVPLTSPATGDVQLVVRPESVKVGAASANEGVRARVQVKHFRGAATALRIQLADTGHVLLAQLPGLARFAEGEEIRVTVADPLAAVP